MACHSYNNGTIHICRPDPEQIGPWERCAEKWPEEVGKGHRVPVSCCERWAPFEDCETQYIDHEYNPIRHYRCAPDAGCNVHAGYRRTAHLRCLFP